MPPAKQTVGIKGKIIHSQGREIISNVLEFMKQEANNGVPTIPLTNFKERLLAATKISDNTYRRIIKETQQIETGASTSFSSPRKQRPRTCLKRTVCDGELAVIRSIIHNFYITDKRRPTLKGMFWYLFTYVCIITTIDMLNKQLLTVP